MSLLPMLFSDWWEDLDRPHRLWDQHFGTVLDPDDLLDLDPLSTEVLLYRPPPPRRGRRRYHPFFKGRRQGRGTSTVQANKDKFQVTLDVSQFTPDEISVKVVDQNVVIEAKHEEKEDEHGWVARQFVRKYIVPSQCDINRVESHLSSDGILTITAPRKEPIKPKQNERIIKIQYTDKPALTNCEQQQQQQNDTSETQNDQECQRGQQQQHQQQLQPQQPQRGRKSTVKAA